MLGDAYGAGIVHHLCKADLDKIDEGVIKEIGDQAMSPLSPMSPFDPFRRMSTHLEVHYEGAVERRRSVFTKYDCSSGDIVPILGISNKKQKLINKRNC